MGIVREQGRLGWRYGAKRACSAVGSCLGIALALAGCQGGEMGSAGRISSSIIGGTPDSGDPAVILLRGSFGGFCSGTLVAPTVVLTAAHCVERGLATA